MKFREKCSQYTLFRHMVSESAALGVSFLAIHGILNRNSEVLVKFSVKDLFFYPEVFPS